MAVNEAARAYKEGTNVDIHKLIQEMEGSIMEEDSEPEMEEWRDLVLDLGKTRGMLSLFKQTLQVYWIMKRLLARALE